MRFRHAFWIPLYYPSPGTPAGRYSSWGKRLADMVVGVRSSLKASANAGLCPMALLCSRYLTSFCPVYASSVIWYRPSLQLFGSAWQPHPPRGPHPVSVWPENTRQGTCGNLLAKSRMCSGMLPGSLTISQPFTGTTTSTTTFQLPQGPSPYLLLWSNNTLRQPTAH